MTKKAQNWFDLPIQLNSTFCLIFYTGYRRDFVRVCKDVNVNVRKVTIKKNIFVVDSTDHVLVLEIPFIIKAQA